MSTIRSFASGSPWMGSTLTSSPRSLSNTLQANRLTPLTRMASDPQTACAQERRNDSEPSTYHFRWCKASRSRSPGWRGAW